MLEVIVPAESKLIGKSVLQARVRSEMGLTVLGLRHGREVVTHGLLDEKLKVGDTLLLTGFWSDIGTPEALREAEEMLRQSSNQGDA